MALQIDGTTYKGFWKITPVLASPNEWSLIPKPLLFLRTTNATTGNLYNALDGGLITNYAYDANCVDGEGNALATSAALANFISQNR